LMYRHDRTMFRGHAVEYLFFFSSRRRHTRWPRDWSSDVCSSDLAPPSRTRPAFIKDPYGNLMEKAGRVRDGGAFWERMGKVACWNTLMDESRYMVRKWNEFVSA